MDALDRRILRQVQDDCSRPAAELAKLCGTTESTALRRLNRMRRDGVIRKEVAIIDGQKVGRGLLLVLNVRLEREDERGHQAFVKRITGHPDVLQFYFVTGSVDYLIILSVRSMEDYDRFLNDYLVVDPLIVMSDTNVVIRQLKMNLALPIDEPAPVTSANR